MLTLVLLAECGYGTGTNTPVVNAGRGVVVAFVPDEGVGGVHQAVVVGWEDTNHEALYHTNRILDG